MSYSIVIRIKNTKTYYVTCAPFFNKFCKSGKRSYRCMMYHGMRWTRQNSHNYEELMFVYFSQQIGDIVPYSTLMWTPRRFTLSPHSSFLHHVTLPSLTPPQPSPSDFSPSQPHLFPTPPLPNPSPAKSSGTFLLAMHFWILCRNPC